MANRKQLAAVEEACRELRAGVAFLKTALRPGLTERQVANRLRAFFRSRGFRRWAFSFIIAAGPAAANPHHPPGHRRLRKGDMVVCDFGLRIRDTASDMTRTFILGNPSRRLARVYRTVRQAQQRAAAALRPRIEGHRIDAIARGILKRAGYEKYFLHATGHGVGYKIHEPPWLSPKKHGVLRAGDVVTVEPGVYRKGWGGIRIEDMYLITARGHRHLSTIPSRLENAIIPL